MIISADVTLYIISSYSSSYFGVWGVKGSLHLLLLPMNTLNQTESATFSILPFWAFFKDLFGLEMLLFLLIKSNYFSYPVIVSQITIFKYLTIFFF
jgi:hypothetical protein